MGTEAGKRAEEKPPQELMPLAKLGWQIRFSKYKPTAKEAEALQKCVDDGGWYNLNGAMLSAAVVWNLTGSGKKLKTFPRLVMTAAAGLFGRQAGNIFAGNSCMKKILTLEGSPLRGELIAILQEDFPDHPLLKAALERHGGSLPKHEAEPVEYGQEASVPVSSKNLGREMDDSNSRGWEGTSGGESAHSQMQIQRIPRIWETSSEKQVVKKEFDGADFLIDPFDLAMQNGFLDESDEPDAEDHHEPEIRRSRMSAKDRREYDRRRYEHRQEQRTY